MIDEPGPQRVQSTDLASLIAQAAGLFPMERRLDQLSLHFLGAPYVEGPLVGSEDAEETLVTRTDGFDCVTYMETVMALAGSKEPADFAGELARFRYDGARISFKTRNHYMTQWMERNEARGRVRRVLHRLWTAEEHPRHLTALDGFPALEKRLAYLPLGAAGELGRHGRTGDILCFVSTRSDLDVFHVGLLVGGKRPGLRHASRSRRTVVEEPLETFLQRNNTPGLIVARLLSRRQGDAA